MASKRDYYEVLGITKGSSDDEIKKAYRKLAKECHPDLHPGDKNCEEKFKEISEAYEVLSDTDKRQKYDQFGHAGFSSDGGFGNGFSDFGDLSDILNNMFKGFGGFNDFNFYDHSYTGYGRANTRQAQRGKNIETELIIDFEEAAFGCEKEVKISRIEICEKCSGSGCAEGSTSENCSDCNGKGRVRIKRNTPFGTILDSSTPCKKCNGRGKIISHPCSNCKGEGKVQKDRKISVKIPAGINDGQVISVNGQGHAGDNNGSYGDLLILITVCPHPYFERKGQDIFYEMPLSFVHATLGAEVEVPTLDGKVKYTVPEGTQNGTTFRLRGKGIPYFKSNSRGDLYVTMHIDVPTNLSREQKELLRKFGDSTGESENLKSGFFERKRKKK